jgi:hypothetical protein
MPTLNLNPSIDEELARFAKFEKMFDNAAYQPSDYPGSCDYFSMDREDPRFLCIKPTAQFNGWQVPVMRLMVERYLNRDPQKDGNAYIVANAIGLGKTWEMLGLWVWVYIPLGQPFSGYIY